MSNDEVYSNKDSNRNRLIDEKQAHITIAIVMVCIVLICIMFGFYYSHHESQSGAVTAKPELPALVSDTAHPYDDSRPPYKQ